MQGERVSIEALWRVLDLLESIKVRYWVAGGWGIDILCGQQHRPHRDVDIDFDAVFTDAVLERLQPAGYEIVADRRPCRMELHHPLLGSLDLHPLEIQWDGSARQAKPEGGWYEFSKSSFTAVAFDGRRIPCLSAAAQELFHSGCELREADEIDLRNLRAAAAERYMPVLTPREIIRHYYPEDTPLRRMLLKHSRQVRDKALELLKNPACANLAVDVELAADGAMLHDIGILRCHAPGILCTGDAPYITHGLIGARMLRDYAASHDMELEAYARICERHTGSGLTAEEVRRESLPLPERDWLPETDTEKLICLADKFFSKSGDMREKTLERIRRSMQKFGEDSVERFDELCRRFGVIR